MLVLRKTAETSSWYEFVLDLRLYKNSLAMFWKCFKIFADFEVQRNEIIHSVVILKFTVKPSLDAGQV